MGILKNYSNRFHFYIYFILKKKLLSPDDSYYDNCRRYLESEGTLVESLKYGINLSENKVAPINTKKSKSYDNSVYNEDD